MNTIVNITGLTLKCLEAGDENAIKKEKKKEYYKQWYLKNREKVIELSRQWSLKNKNKLKKTSKERYFKNKDELKKKSKEWYLKNKDKIKEKRKKYHQKYYLKYQNILKQENKEYYLKNKNIIKEKHKEYYSKNKIKVKKRYQKNKKRINLINNIRRKKRWKEQPNTYILHVLRGRINGALKGKSKSASTMNLLGIPNVEFLWNHLEKSFKPGMTKENHGEWHVDHIRPCSNFDLSKPEEQSKCFHYTNLQALWAYENLSKGDRFVA